MAKISESIFNGKSVVVPMADVQHIQKNRQTCDHADGSKAGDISCYTIVTRHTRWDGETDDWANPVIVGKEEGEAFLRAWCDYRHELEGGAEAFFGPDSAAEFPVLQVTCPKCNGGINRCLCSECEGRGKVLTEAGIAIMGMVWDCTRLQKLQREFEQLRRSYRKDVEPDLRGM